MKHQTKEQFQHDICPRCQTASVPAEQVPDQSLRGCPKCEHVWAEDLSSPPTEKETKHPPGLFLPVSVERSGIAGKTFLHDDAGKWIADVNSRHADEIAAKLNSHDELLAALKDLVLTIDHLKLYPKCNARHYLFEVRCAADGKLVEHGGLQQARNILDKIGGAA